MHHDLVSEMKFSGFQSEEDDLLIDCFDTGKNTRPSRQFTCCLRLFMKRPRSADFRLGRMSLLRTQWGA